MKKLLLLLTLAYSPAWAEWTQLGITFSSDNESGLIALYVDVDSMRKNEFGAAIKTMMNYETPRVAGPGPRYQSVVSKQEIICKPRRARVKVNVFYSGKMGAGEVLYTSKEPGEWRQEAQLAANSIGGVISGWVCDGKKLSL